MLTKNKFKILASAFILAGCQGNPVEDLNIIEGKQVITFSVSPSITVESRAALSEACDRLEYYNYKDGKLESKIVQTASEGTFGTLKDTLSIGEHEILIVGSKGASFNVDYPDWTITPDKMNDNFSILFKKTIDGGASSAANIELLRNVTKFELLATDAIPEGTDSIVIRATGGCRKYNAKDRVGTAEYTQVKSIFIPESYKGKKDVTFSLYSYIPATEGPLGILVSSKDKEGKIIYQHYFADVPMKINRITRYKGSFFKNDLTAIWETIEVENWLDPMEIEF